MACMLDNHHTSYTIFPAPLPVIFKIMLVTANFFKKDTAMSCYYLSTETKKWFSKKYLGGTQ